MLLDEFQLKRAVAQNSQWGSKLGWSSLFTPISVYYLRLQAQPSKREFAEAIAGWQRTVMHVANPDGILDAKTWQNMRRLGEPVDFALNSVTQRPHNYKDVCDTFGNPSVNHERWKKANIVKIYAPTGMKFRWLSTGRQMDYVWGHRVLEDNYKALFMRIAADGLWNLIQPVSGPYNYRTQRSADTKLSMHAFGIAIDIRPDLYIRGRIQPYPDLRVIEIMREHGFHWGIFFQKPDPHHFQFATGA